jgi:hypothetical protein
VIQEVFSDREIYRLSNKIYSEFGVDEVVNFWINQAQGESFVLDSCVPDRFQMDVKADFLAKGYIPVLLDWEVQPSMKSKVGMKKDIEAYLTQSHKRSPKQPLTSKLWDKLRRLTNKRL